MQETSGTSCRLSCSTPECKSSCRQIDLSTLPVSALIAMRNTWTTQATWLAPVVTSGIRCHAIKLKLAGSLTASAVARLNWHSACCPVACPQSWSHWPNSSICPCKSNCRSRAYPIAIGRTKYSKSGMPSQQATTCLPFQFCCAVLMSLL